MDFTALFDGIHDRSARDDALVEAARTAEHEASRPLRAHPTRTAVNVLDLVPAAPCPRCGTDGWCIDGHEDDVWLLCLDLKDSGCIETKPVPRWFDVSLAHEAATGA